MTDKKIYNFDEIINRSNTNSVKWNAGELLKKFGITERFDDETISLFVADMDFASPQPVIDALYKRVEQKMFGYSTHVSNNEYFDAIQSWFKRRQNWTISAEDIIYSPGTVHALDVAVRAFTAPGEGVIIQRPVYFPFTSVVEKNNRKVINNSLINNDGYYTIDFEDLKNKAKVPTTTMFILCSPHNPVGRIWKPAELKQIAEICSENNVVLVADEIHGDLIRSDETFFPIANIADNENLVICTAINKTFNLAGLHCSNIIISNADLKEKYNKEMGMQLPSPFTISALIAAYNDGENWLEQLNKYLDNNFNFLEQFLSEKMPKVKFLKPEGTYIGWLDFSKYNLSPKEVHLRIYNKANVVLEDGKIFGEEGIEFQRICIPTPKSIIEKAMERIYRQFRT